MDKIFQYSLYELENLHQIRQNWLTVALVVHHALVSCMKPIWTPLKVPKK